MFGLRSKKSLLPIANEAGHPNLNMCAMVKNGASKIVLDRAP